MLKTALAAIATTISLIGTLAAQSDYPSRPIRLVVPFAAGGSTDAQARVIAEFAGRALGQSIVVVNAGGAGGTIGLTQVARATPDGYTLATATPSLTLNPFIQKDIGYDPLKDFEPVVEIAVSPIVLVVPKDSPIKSVQDVIDLAKAKPGQLRYGSAGIGSATHLSTALFTSLAGVDMVHVPYRGAGPAILDLIAGRLDMQFENAPSVLGQIKSGELRAIAVGTAKRSTTLPDLPPIGETVQGYEATSWFGVLAPAGTPRPIVDKLNAAINKALGDPTVQKQLEAIGAERVGGTPEQFAAFLKARFEEMKTVSKSAHLVPQ
jgi:tripartite-type tricarboxylate transporter receptor subunit TctC